MRSNSELYNAQVKIQHDNNCYNRLQLPCALAALWLWLWPWQPKPCPVRTTARSKSSKSFPFPLTEETHTEGHTSKNLASLPGEPRPEDKIPQRKRKIHMGFYLCIEKCLSKKFEVFFCWRLLGFFCAHAVRAQSSDGHKNVLSLIGYSHMLENR